MPTATQKIEGVHYDQLMEGVDQDVRKQVEDALYIFVDEEDQSAQGEKNRADKLRGAFNALYMFLVSNKLNDLNGPQMVFMCSGALDEKVAMELDGQVQDIPLLPPGLYPQLLTSLTAPVNYESEFPVYHTLARFTAIAKGDLLAFDIGDDRKKALRNSPQDVKRAMDEWRRKADQMRREIGVAVNQLDMFHPKFVASISENALKNVRMSVEMMKKVSGAWSRGDAATPQEKAIVKAFEGKMGDVGAGMAKWADEVTDQLRVLSENARLVSDRWQGILKAQVEIEKGGNGGASVAHKNGPLFDTDEIVNIKKDVDTTISVSVRAAESSPLKVPFSAARILVDKQLIEGENPMERICTPQSVTEALVKITQIHTNVFPKDEQGRYIVSPILLEPLRNFVDFFEDRFIMGVVSGETSRKGPFVSFTPVEIQVLRLCALWLTKDPIYDYRGDVKTGTFMGDYVGRIEKSTKVKWTGQDKKFTLAATQSMADAASRDDALVDYVDFVFAMANGTSPNPKLSKRKICVLLRYVMFDKIEKNVAGILRMVVQQEPEEAKNTIMSYAHEKVDVAKDMIKAAMQIDPQTAKMYSDNAEFAIQRVFGRG
jgi:NOL1/NOP2/fmu family ribosome biogenesis protein